MSQAMSSSSSSSSSTDITNKQQFAELRKQLAEVKAQLQAAQQQNREKPAEDSVRQLALQPPKFDGDRLKFAQFLKRLIVFLQFYHCATEALQGVKGIPKNAKGDKDNAEVEKLKLESSKGAIDRSQRGFAYIYQSVDGAAAALLDNVDTRNSFEALNILKSNFGLVKTPNAGTELYKEFTNIKKGESESMPEFITRFETLINNLKQVGHEVPGAVVPPSLC